MIKLKPRFIATCDLKMGNFIRWEIVSKRFLKIFVRDFYYANPARNLSTAEMEKSNLVECDVKEGKRIKFLLYPDFMKKYNNKSGQTR